MIEYERKFKISKEIAMAVAIPSYSWIHQEDLFPFGVFKNGFMVRLRMESSWKGKNAFLTVKWWDLLRRRVEHEFSIPYSLVDALLRFPSLKYRIVKTRAPLKDGIFIDYVFGLGYFIEMEKVLPAPSVATKEQREAIDQEFKAKFKELTGMEGNFADFSYSQRLFGKE